MSVNSEISTGIKSGHGTAILYAAMLGLIVSDIMPTAADAVYFNWERKLRDKWKAGQITAKQYWWQETLIYYGLNPIYWVLIMLIVISIPGGAAQKTKVAIAIIGAGAAIGVIYKNMQKDTAQQDLEEMQRLELLKQYPQIEEIINKPEFKDIFQSLKNKQ